MTPVERLQTAVEDATASDLDRAALLRHVIRQESERNGFSFRFPCPDLSYDLPDSVLNKCGLVSHEQGDGHIEALPWRPTWLQSPDRRAIDAGAAKAEHRRTTKPCGYEPMLELATSPPGNAYTSTGQRDVIRAVLSMPAGATLLVNLPTGAGKSMCSLLPAVLQHPFEESNEGQVSVVVVPTVALAQDQARKAAEFFKGPLAYLGGAGELRLAENRLIAKRIESNEQQIVFAAPESLSLGLKRPLFEAAKRGYLRSLIVDEAHMVDQWGDAFRPEFQHMAGLRQALMALQPSLRTVLLSATVTAWSLESLKTFFGTPDTFASISACGLRSEPEYWLSGCDHPQEKRKRVLEAVYHLPRPLILYASKVADAEEYLQMLKNQGYSRIGLMTGKTSESQRARLIKNWAQNKVDIVVGTSAFGLGIDKADVRCVVHACVPETVDRLYQEVGRGGRDGAACLSLMIYAPEDLKTAEHIRRRTFIGDTKGFQRWSNLFDHATPLGDQRYEVDISRAPIYDGQDFSEANQRHEEWNAHTLTLMGRAKIIAFSDQAPPPHELSSAEKWVVRVLTNHHNEQKSWIRLVDFERRKSENWVLEQTGLMRRFLAQEECVSDVFHDAYRIRGVASVARACGGCPHCRRQQRPPFADNPRSSPFPWERRDLKVEPEAIYYRSAQEKNWPELGKKLLASGIKVIVGPSSLLESLAPAVRELSSSVFFEDRFRESLACLPTAVFLPANSTIPPELESRLQRPRLPERLIAVLSQESTMLENGRRAYDFISCRKTILH